MHILGKAYDAVESMRQIREKLNKEYSKDPGLRKKRLQKIHREYGIVKQNQELQKISEEIKPNSYLNKKHQKSKPDGRKN